jgi:hypothetical protein
VLIRPAWRYLFVLPTSFFGTVAWARDEFLSPETAEKLKMPLWLPHWPWYLWVITTLAIIIALILEASFRLSRELSSGSNVSVPPLTRITGSSTKSVQIVIETGSQFESVALSCLNISRTIRVKIQNNTDNEIYNGALKLLNLDPPNGDHKDFMLKDGITISPRRFSFIDVAAYNEGTANAQAYPKARRISFTSIIRPIAR